MVEGLGSLKFCIFSLDVSALEILRSGSVHVLQNCIDQGLDSFCFSLVVAIIKYLRQVNSIKKRVYLAHGSGSRHQLVNGRTQFETGSQRKTGVPQALQRALTQLTQGPLTRSHLSTLPHEDQGSTTGTFRDKLNPYLHRSTVYGPQTN